MTGESLAVGREAPSIGLGQRTALGDRTQPDNEETSRSPSFSRTNITSREDEEVDREYKLWVIESWRRNWKGPWDLECDNISE